MKIQTEILSHAADAQLVATVEQKVSKLQLFFNHIKEVRVILSAQNAAESKNERTAEIKLHVPNGVIFIKESSKSFEIALDKALVALKLQLLKYKSKRMSYGLNMQTATVAYA
jgi:putative sigma-54 modulation protein